MKEEDINRELKKLIDNCSKTDLDFIIINELSEDEKISLITERTIEVKENIIQNFNYSISE